MIKMRTLKKTFSLLLVCFLLSSIHCSQALALKQQEELMCSGLDKHLLEELTTQLLSQVINTTTPISEEDPAIISVEQFDVLGFIVIYYIFMFLYYGLQCVETLDPGPCESMVTNLLLALFLGILLEGV